MFELALCLVIDVAILVTLLLALLLRVDHLLQALVKSGRIAGRDLLCGSKHGLQLIRTQAKPISSISSYVVRWVVPRRTYLHLFVIHQTLDGAVGQHLARLLVVYRTHLRVSNACLRVWVGDLFADSPLVIEYLCVEFRVSESS